MNLYTIGFTQKPAQSFFESLAEHKIDMMIDVRAHPGGQLSGFAKQKDLIYFLDRLLKCGYQHLPDLAPTEEIFSAYRASHDWTQYRARFEALLDARHIPDSLDRLMFNDHRCCLLCSEPKPDTCHRILVAERLQRHWADVHITHIA